MWEKFVTGYNIITFSNKKSFSIWQKTLLSRLHYWQDDGHIQCFFYAKLGASISSVFSINLFLHLRFSFFMIWFPIFPQPLHLSNNVSSRGYKIFCWGSGWANSVTCCPLSNCSQKRAAPSVLILPLQPWFLWSHLYLCM